ncbi:MAG TPA: hypothetical protein VMZ51_06760 [Acidimicrobiales bacterium]|nr:hypothetical protein [Acidimicrobiales bacterium]
MAVDVGLRPSATLGDNWANATLSASCAGAALARAIRATSPGSARLLVALALRFAARRVPREAIEEAWPGERRLLDRLLGPSNLFTDGLATHPGDRAA